MKNRYNKILREYNEDILDLVPYNPFLFNIAAKEIIKIYKKGDHILEIGSGEGDSVLPLLQQSNIKIDLLDISKEMLMKARKKLSKYKNRTTYICEDGQSYLKRSKPYNIIFAAWTLHNFNSSDREKLFRTIYANLAIGGSFVLMDKVYPLKDGRVLLKKQNRRYSRYLPPKVASIIIAHEIEDASDPYRMDEKNLLPLLKQIGFRVVSLIDRIDRDVVLIARK